MPLNWETEPFQIILLNCLQIICIKNEAIIIY